MVCYNSAQSIRESLDSLFSQDYESVESIIIDGGSTDGTLAILKEYESKISILVSEPDKGLYDALNKGFKNASGDIIGILHSDDLFYDSTTLSKVAAAFTAEIDAVYGDLLYIKKGEEQKIHRKWISGKYKEGDFYNGWMPPHPTFFVRKPIFEQFGYFNTTFRLAADYELMLRFIHKHKIRLAYISHYLVKMRVGGMSNANVKNRLKANNEDRKAWEINGIKPKFYTLWLKPLSKLKQFIG
jgi:glycosyltransferase involved in cell wall biosynthesis